MREPSPRRRRFASESRRVPHVLHRKQFRCHRFPAVFWSASGPAAMIKRGGRCGTKNGGVGEEVVAPRKSKKTRGPRARSTVRPFVRPSVHSSNRSVSDHKKTTSSKIGKGQATQQRTYQAQRPCPPPGSGSRFKKSQPCLDETHRCAPVAGLESAIYLSTAFARKDIVLHRALQVVVHGCWLVLCCLLWPDKGSCC